MSGKTKPSKDLRLNILIAVFIFVSALFIVRLFSIQVLNHDKYRAMAEDQYYNAQELPAKRGSIISSDGYVLASTQNYYLMYAEPQTIVDKAKTAQAIFDTLKSLNDSKKPILPAESEVKSDTDVPTPTPNSTEPDFERISQIVNSNLYWAIVQKDITPPEKQFIESKNIEGVGFEDEPVRYYPEGKLAANVLGFVAGDDKEVTRGYFGIEGNFDGELRGKPGKILEQKDALGDPILIGKYTKVDSINGRDVILTLNRSVQYIVERRLKEGIEKYDAKSGSVLVMNPKTGEIIAMASYPTFDPSNFNVEPKAVKDSKADRMTVERRNLGISETYEPGSVMKPFTIASAIDLGKITPETTFDDAGPVKYSDYYIDNWNGKHLGIQNIYQLLQKSNNIGAAWVGHQVGAQNLTKYFKDFGFGSITNIDLEGEESGLVRDADTLTGIDLANISFGQGISATPLQVLTAFNSLINGGNLMRPKIISKVIDNGKEIPIPDKLIRKVISQKTSDTMHDLLVQAVEGGESKYYNLKNYIIGGKTGTAQIPVNGHYDPLKSNATFIGYLENSENYSMIVRLNQPTVSIYAAETAVPLWMDITSDLVSYYGILPDR